MLIYYVQQSQCKWYFIVCLSQITFIKYFLNQILELKLSNLLGYIVSGKLQPSSLIGHVKSGASRCNVHVANYVAEIYRIHSNKHPGHLDKSFQVGTYLFQYLLEGSTQKIMILAILSLIPAHIELIEYVSFMNRSGQIFD